LIPNGCRYRRRIPPPIVNHAHSPPILNKAGPLSSPAHRLGSPNPWAACHKFCAEQTYRRPSSPDPPGIAPPSTCHILHHESLDPSGNPISTSEAYVVYGCTTYVEPRSKHIYTVSLYNTSAEHRCTLSTDPNEPIGSSLAAPNGTNRSDLTPPDVGPLYNHPHPPLQLGFPRWPDNASIKNCHHLDLHPVLGFPHPCHSDKKVSMVAAHQNWRWRHDRLGGRGGASSIAIGFSSAEYSEAGQESSIAIIGSSAVDLVAAMR
jgi:hypothetical protein